MQVQGNLLRYSEYQEGKVRMDIVLDFEEARKIREALARAARFLQEEETIKLRKELEEAIKLASKPLD